MEWLVCVCDCCGRAVNALLTLANPNCFRCGTDCPGGLCCCVFAAGSDNGVKLTKVLNFDALFRAVDEDEAVSNPDCSTWCFPSGIDNETGEGNPSVAGAPNEPDEDPCAANSSSSSLQLAFSCSCSCSDDDADAARRPNPTRGLICWAPRRAATNESGGAMSTGGGPASCFIGAMPPALLPFPPALEQWLPQSPPGEDAVLKKNLAC